VQGSTGALFRLIRSLITIVTGHAKPTLYQNEADYIYIVGSTLMTDDENRCKLTTKKHDKPQTKQEAYRKSTKYIPM
jgi:hypothetical protein